MKLRLSKSLITLSIIFPSVGCDGFPKIDPVERCVISFDFQKCRCHMYKFDNPPGERRVSDSYDEPIAYCHNAVAFRTNPGGAWSTIVSWMDEIYFYLRDKKDRIQEFINREETRQR